MTRRDEKKLLLNARMEKFVGIHRMLDPENISICGRNVHHIIVVLLVLFLCPVSIATGVSSLYYWKNNTTAATLYLGIAENYAFVCYKILIVVYYSEDIWNCMQITRFDFASHGHRDKRVLRDWRSRIVLYTNTFLTVSYGSLVYFVTLPLVFDRAFVDLENHDGSFGTYRLNVVNLCLFVPDETYNRHFHLFYAIETTSMIIFVLFITVFETSLITLCLAIAGQLQAISRAIESLGHGFRNRST